MQQSSIITRINLAMSAIIVMAISTIMMSYWLSDQADYDAYAINVTGSLRMHSYRVVLAQDESSVARVSAIFSDPVIANVIHNAHLTDDYLELQKKWQNLYSFILGSEVTNQEKIALLDAFAVNLNQLVEGIQHNSERNIRALRTFQVIAFFITVILSAIVIYWIHLRFTIPLNELTHTARQISRGDFTCNISPSGNDELGVLSRSFEHMTKAIAYMYESLEKQVEDKTSELRNSNKTLGFLYDIARRISAHEVNKSDFNSILEELALVTGLENIELCLLTDGGDIPYLQINGSKELNPDCATRNCRDCIKGVAGADNEVHIPITRDNHDYGVLIIHDFKGELLDWQRTLMESVANLIAIALNLQSEEENIRRITLIDERNVIARELHDSLAQALSYLKIQVTRLNRAIGTSNFEIMMDVSTELKQGLDSAYRQLRELLTTFRLKVDGRGLSEALAKTITQYKEQSEMAIVLDYQIMNIPLTPQEEIHLLQIIRESCQNAIHHSHGKTIRISLQRNGDNSVKLTIDDDGIGIEPNPEKRNHYGLAIIQERSRQLKGEASIERRDEGGTRVTFDFVPQFFGERKSLSGV
ncbi:MAG: ATP-binding protein [Venatoribacter sp.]